MQINTFIEKKPEFQEMLWTILDLTLPVQKSNYLKQWNISVSSQPQSLVQKRAFGDDLFDVCLDFRQNPNGQWITWKERMLCQLQQSCQDSNLQWTEVQIEMMEKVGNFLIKYIDHIADPQISCMSFITKSGNGLHKSSEVEISDSEKLKVDCDILVDKNKIDEETSDSANSSGPQLGPPPYTGIDQFENLPYLVNVFMESEMASQNKWVWNQVLLHTQQSKNKHPMDQKQFVQMMQNSIMDMPLVMISLGKDYPQDSSENALLKQQEYLEKLYHLGGYVNSLSVEDQSDFKNQNDCNNINKTMRNNYNNVAEYYSRKNKEKHLPIQNPEVIQKSLHDLTANHAVSDIMKESKNSKNIDLHNRQVLCLNRDPLNKHKVDLADSKDSDSVKSQEESCNVNSLLYAPLYNSVPLNIDIGITPEVVIKQFWTALEKTPVFQKIEHLKQLKISINDKNLGNKTLSFEDAFYHYFLLSIDSSKKNRNSQGIETWVQHIRHALMDLKDEEDEDNIYSHSFISIIVRTGLNLSLSYQTRVLPRWSSPLHLNLQANALLNSQPGEDKKIIEAFFKDSVIPILQEKSKNSQINFNNKISSAIACNDQLSKILSDYYPQNNDHLPQDQQLQNEKKRYDFRDLLFKLGKAFQPSVCQALSAHNLENLKDLVDNLERDHNKNSAFLLYIHKYLDPILELKQHLPKESQELWNSIMTACQNDALENPKWNDEIRKKIMKTSWLKKGFQNYGYRVSNNPEASTKRKEFVTRLLNIGKTVYAWKENRTPMNAKEDVGQVIDQQLKQLFEELYDSDVVDREDPIFYFYQAIQQDLKTGCQIRQIKYQDLGLPEQSEP